MNRWDRSTQTWSKDYSVQIGATPEWQASLAARAAEQAAVVDMCEKVGGACGRREISFVIVKDESGPPCPECGVTTQVRAVLYFIVAFGL